MAYVLRKCFAGDLGLHEDISYFKQTPGAARDHAHNAKPHRGSRLMQPPDKPNNKNGAKHQHRAAPIFRRRFHPSTHGSPLSWKI